MKIFGTLYPAGSSKAVTCSASVFDSKMMLNHEDGEQKSYDFANAVLGEPILGQSQEITFSDGSRFLPEDVKFRWPTERKRLKLVENLEQNLFAVLGAIVFSPILIYGIMFKVVPALAVQTYDLVPDSVVQEMGEQSMYAIEQAVLEPTTLSVEEQQTVTQLWDDSLQKLSLSRDQFKLSFYQSDFFGANAFALPHGQIVVTDDLVKSMQDHPLALQAVLLHEIGHVEKQHSIRMAAQAAAGAIAFAMIFGDLEGFAEVVLGTGSTILQQRFSQGMEKEADAFALQHMKQHGIDPKEFAKALEIIVEQAGIELENDEEGAWSKYLSTHPSIKSRIDYANAF
jgi:Zn-dependent protease with chaperone function